MGATVKVPKKIHMVLGCDHLETWEKFHPNWGILTWNVNDLQYHTWRLRRHIDYFLEENDLYAASTLMKYEILYIHGGIVVDTDIECLRPFDDICYEFHAFCALENEEKAQGIASNAILGSVRRNPTLRWIIDDIASRRHPLRIGPRLWKNAFKREVVSTDEAIGSGIFTKAIIDYGGFDVFPSGTFYPVYSDGSESPRTVDEPHTKRHWTAAPQRSLHSEARDQAEAMKSAISRAPEKDRSALIATYLKLMAEQ